MEYKENKIVIIDRKKENYFRYLCVSLILHNN